ncbi:conserved hypothetical protein [Thiomonas sp. CB3]|nr:conserved hypothetical protein [Thiomonas sp. CB3]
MPHHIVKSALNIAPISRPFDAISPVFGLVPALQTHSSHGALQNALAHHPQVRQCEHHQQLARVLGQAPITCLAMSELAFDHPKRVLHLGTNAGLGFLQSVHDRPHGRVLLQRFAVAGHHGHMPTDLRVILNHLFAFVHATVTGVGKDIAFFAMEQGAGLRDIVRVGAGAHHRVHQARVGIHANVRFHPKMPLISLLGLVHLGVAFSLGVLGRTGGRNQGGIDDGAGLEQQSLPLELGVDRLQDLRAQVVRFEQVAKPQDGALVGQARGADIKLGKFAVQRDVVQGLFHRRIGVPEELLQQVNAQHDLGGKRRPAGLACGRMWRDQGQQLRPRNHPVHFVEKFPLARALRSKLKSGRSKADLFHLSSTYEPLCRLTFAEVP